jgi:peptidoglycan/LPS O-acetylase OafA/YrhL
LAGLLILSALTLAAVAYHYDGLDLGNTWSSYFAGWGRVFWSFFAGVMLYRRYSRKRRAALPSWVGILLMLAVAILFASPSSDVVFSVASAFLCFPLIIWIGAQVRLAGLAARVASWLGLISYAVYITHLPVLTLTLDAADLLHIYPAASFVVRLTVVAGIAVAVAWLLDRVYDRPIRNWLSRRRARPGAGERLAASEPDVISVGEG